jgi:uncharacterized PurR-regulated membrane protein YhhQ (DUF165 family)
MTILLVGLYLAAIVIANITVALFGPSVVVLNAFLFIGLDLTTRDRLHEQWQTGRAWKMGLLIAAGSLISWLLNRAVAPIALASCVAFALSAIADTIVYTWLHDRPWWVKVNGSNVVSAAVDSLLFPTLAFRCLPAVDCVGAVHRQSRRRRSVGCCAWSVSQEGHGMNATVHVTGSPRSDDSTRASVSASLRL